MIWLPTSRVCSGCRHNSAKGVAALPADPGFDRVGDAEFVKRAEDRLKGLVGNASILVLASHDPKIINDLCNRTIRLERGRIAAMDTIPATA